MSAYDVIATLDAAALTTPNLSDRIALADRATSKHAFLNRRDEAVAYLTLHQLYLGRIAAAGGAGRITSASVGAVSRSFGAAKATDDGDLSSTAWGQALIRLRQECISGAPTRSMGVY